MISSEGIAVFKICRPFEAICDIKDFKMSFPTANNLFPAKMKRSAIIASSSLDNIVRAPLLTLGGAFQPSFTFSGEEFSDYTSVRLR